MSKESRLCYHAVPRIMKTNVNWLNTPMNDAPDDFNPKEQEADIDSSESVEHKNRKKQRLTLPNDNDNQNDSFVENLWTNIADSKQWQPFADYINDCRINVNVRQVLEHGEQSLNLK